ncbi:MAG: YbaB/EbfC family nucleoid-associated protein [Candidatus Azotimanducaceae bacterium]|uniref:Nucleoid-associated protein EVA68_07785 n=1 Tax=OM182 bacterium TaxID=2510334 RepID=A0A520RY28_9GAMM|nr:YbaB/EbfC family nucleoid-associated protein [Gammaproteobacteria bacterium]RZO75101.1 MAG: YbaB/EbfC family nucleoid-associated protein [OM182 bacterium]
MMKGLGDMMKQAQAMQQQVQKIQEEIAATEVKGESGAGLVKVSMSGQYDVKSVEIDPAVMDENKEVIEDLIASAVNDAVRRVENNRKDQMADITSGIPLPPGFKFPFT